MREDGPDGLLGFQMVYGVSSDRVYAESIRNVMIIRHGNCPYSLLSVGEMVKNKGAEHSLRKFRSIVGVLTFKARQIWDSGGFSVSTGNIVTMNLRPERICDYYHRFPCVLGIGADAPLYNLSFEQLQLRNIKRMRGFYKALRQPSDMLIYEVIQGQLIIDGCFSLEEKQRWIQMVKNLLGDSMDGWAMRLVYDQGVAVAGYFALLAWSHRVENQHILGTARIEIICVLVYLSKFYKRLSTDATNFTIKAVTNPAFWYFEKGRPRMITFKKKTQRQIIAAVEKCTSLEGGSCAVCAYMSSKFGRSFGKLFRKFGDVKHDKASEQRKLLNDQLNEWLVTHNIAVIERFIEELKKHASVSSEYVCHLQKIGMSSVAKAITEVIDPVTELGPAAYPKQIQRLGKPKQKTSEWSYRLQVEKEMLRPIKFR